MNVNHPKVVQHCTIYRTVQYGATNGQRYGNVVVIARAYLVTMDAAIYSLLSSPS